MQRELLKRARDCRFVQAALQEFAAELPPERVGPDYRLLFRLHSKTIEFLTLIPRRDLERKLKSLVAV